MNHDVNGTSGMGPKAIMAPSNTYTGDGWTSMSPYSQSPYSTSPLTEYNFGSYLPQGIPSESINRMPPPSHQPHQMMPPSAPMAHHQLPMLNTTWPSQLTNPTPTGGSYSAPPLSVPPLPSVPLLVDPPMLPTQQLEKGRKTLSSEQKRAMCQFHQDHPGIRQADIGARFGVERSTVSKVLRQKDQFLKRTDSEPEPEQVAAKRVKLKHPDFDRTLSNYVRRQQQRGFEVQDDEIMEQAKLFAHAGGNQDSLLSTLTNNWLKKFKQKHGIGAGRLMRRASEANIPDSARMSTILPKTDSNNNNKKKEEETGWQSSITSPTLSGQMSPPSASRSDEEIGTNNLEIVFSHNHEGSQSTTSLANDAKENATSSFSGTMSPKTPFTFSPDPNMGGFPVDPNLQLRSNGPGFLRRDKRSNTFPSLNIEGVNQGSPSEPLTPQYQISATAPSSAVDSPAQELQAAPFSVDTSVTSPPSLRRSSSNSSINGRSANTPINSGAVPSTPNESSPISPSHEDARRAAVTLLSYLSASNGQFDQSEFMTVVQLTKKLQIHQHSTMRPSIGVLSRIPEGEVDLPTMVESAIETV